MNVRLLVLLFFVVITGMLSCKDKDLPTPPGATTALNVVNATADTIKYYINGTRQNNTSPIFVGGATGYLSVLAGTQNYKFSKSNRGFPVLFTTTFDLDTLTNYSIFVCGETADKTFKTIDPLEQADTLLAHDKTLKSSVIRFVNCSPDAGPLNVTVGVGDTVNVNSAPFEYVGNYTLFTGGVKHVKVYQGGSSTPKIDTIITFNTTSIYTLFTKGLLNGKGNAQFSVSLINAEN
jgi:hypothetical protein